MLCLHIIFIVLTGSLGTNVLAQSLNKIPLTNGLSFLQDGLLEHLHPVHSSYIQWVPDYIPIDCKDLTEQNNFSAADVVVYNVQYDDVSTSARVRDLDLPPNYLTSALTILGFSAATKTALILSRT